MKRHQKPVVFKYRVLIVIYYSHLFLYIKLSSPVLNICKQCVLVVITQGRGFVTTHELGHIMYGYTLLVHIDTTLKACFITRFTKFFFVTFLSFYLYYISPKVYKDEEPVELLDFYEIIGITVLAVDDWSKMKLNAWKKRSHVENCVETLIRRKWKKISSSNKTFCGRKFLTKKLSPLKFWHSAGYLAQIKRTKWLFNFLLTGLLFCCFGFGFYFSFQQNI